MKLKLDKGKGLRRGEVIVYAPDRFAIVTEGNYDHWWRRALRFFGFKKWGKQPDTITLRQIE